MRCLSTLVTCLVFGVDKMLCGFTSLLCCLTGFNKDNSTLVCGLLEMLRGFTSLVSYANVNDIALLFQLFLPLVCNLYSQMHV